VSNEHTVHLTVRNCPLRVDYRVDVEDGPVLECVMVGDIKVWPVSDPRAVLRWFEISALDAVQKDWSEVVQAMQDEEQDRKPEVEVGVDWAKGPDMTVACFREVERALAERANR